MNTDLSAILAEQLARREARRKRTDNPLNLALRDWRIPEMGTDVPALGTPLGLVCDSHPELRV